MFDSFVDHLLLVVTCFERTLSSVTGVGQSLESQPATATDERRRMAVRRRQKR